MIADAAAKPGTTLWVKTRLGVVGVEFVSQDGDWFTVKHGNPPAEGSVHKRWVHRLFIDASAAEKPAPGQCVLSDLDWRK